MNWRPASTYKNHSSTRIVNAISKRLMLAGAVVLVATIPALPQNPELQEKLAAVKAVAAENKQQLHQYQWTETTQLTLKGDPKPPTRKYVPVRSRRPSPEDSDRSSSGTTQRWQAEGKNHREEKSGDERLHARRQSRPRHVRAARSTANAAGLPGRKRRLESCPRRCESGFY